MSKGDAKAKKVAYFAKLDGLLQVRRRGFFFFSR